jgi:hypothetical protein
VAPKQTDFQDVLDTFGAFLDRYGTGEVLVAIDPGANGAIALRTRTRYLVVDIPTIKVPVKRVKKTSPKERKATGKKSKTVDGSTTKFDFAGICALFRLLRPYREDVVVVLEEVPVSLGPGKRVGEILLNRAYAMWPLFLYSKGYIVNEVRPSVWKQKMGLSGKDKDHCRLKAISLFPRAPLQRKQDHDRAEALLLTEYFRREFRLTPD